MANAGLIFESMTHPQGKSYVRERALDVPPEPPYAEVRNVEGKAESKPAMRHAPQRTHDQEKNYSPALKRTGGYSHVPEETKTPVKKPEPHKYNPDVECPEDYVPPQPPDKLKPLQGKQCPYNGQIYYIRNGNVYDLKGNLQPNHIRNAVFNQCNQQHSK